MEHSSHEEAEIPMPINSAYVGVHGHHGGMIHQRYHPHYHGHFHAPPPSSSSHNHQNINLSANNSNGTNTITASTTATPSAILQESDRRLQQNPLHCDYNDDDNGGLSTEAINKKKMMVRYRECQRNHAACMGGNATDGCGEFLPSGEEGSIESLTCSVCNCHRNFHRKEVEGEHNMNVMMMMIPPHPTHSTHSPLYPSTSYPHLLSNRGRKVILGGNGAGHPTVSGQVVPALSRSVGASLPCDNADDGNNGGGMMMVMRPNYHHYHNPNIQQAVKKRFRTKFSQEQKEKMLEFAEKVGWKIQRQEESVVQQFCQQLGIKRRVLKVWMHNNKHNFAKKNDIMIDNNDINNSSKSNLASYLR